MHSRYRHLIPAFALALTASCSPIAYIDFPDGGGAEGGNRGVVSNGGLQSRVINLKRIGPPVVVIPDAANVVGMDRVDCPETLSVNKFVEFKYINNCGGRSASHQVICKYQPDTAGSEEPIAALNFSEDAALPYIIHSEANELNTLQATGTVVLRYKDLAHSGTELVQMVSITKPGAAVLDTTKPESDVKGGSVHILRNSTIRIPENVTMKNIVSLEIYATVHCSVYKNMTISTTAVHVADGGTLLRKDTFDPFSWKISAFSVDTIAK